MISTSVKAEENLGLAEIGGDEFMRLGIPMLRV